MRLPIHTGTKLLARLPIVILIAVLIGAAYGHTHADSLMGSSTIPPWELFKWFLICPCVCFVLAAVLIADEASDCHFDHEGLRVVGGIHSGLRINWSTLREQALCVTDGCLIIHLDQDTSIRFLRAGSSAEERSLEALRSTLAFYCRQATNASQDRGPAASECSDPGVLRCPDCGIPAEIDDSTHVSCRACGSKVAVPSLLRERLRASRDLGPIQRSVAQLIERTQSQADAKLTNRMLIFVTVFGVVWLPLPLTFGAYPLFVISAFFMLAIYLMAHSVVAGRHALLVLGADCSPLRGSNANLCCDCGAPLRKSQPEEVVVRCVYCQTSNVLGLDLVVERKRMGAAHASLEANYAQHRRSMRRHRWGIAGGTCALVLGSYVAWNHGALTADRLQPEPGIKFGTYCHDGRCTFSGLDGESRRTLRRVSHTREAIFLEVSRDANLEELAEVGRLVPVTQLHMPYLYRLGTLDPKILQAFPALRHLVIDTRNFSSLEPILALHSLPSLCVQRELPDDAAHALGAALPQTAITRFPCH